ncbi:hypothetical protein QTJ16_004413 [Diplocarpon rosae]|uniref:Peptidase S54 rhomboid domain-containing protein n=1 Tax=Diplocarpon rosae TaxID=946125 RepID=A0AAD9SYL7_9HELO|nr:hypothetical protein QTJ16_004413 [Diplocarpon rosae]
MNSLWPAAPRLRCFNPRAFFRSCHKIGKAPATLGQRSIQTHMISRLPFRREYCQVPRQISRISPGAANKLPAGIRTFASERIITSYAELPSGYKDEDGLAYRTKPLSEEEVHAIFGNVIDVNTAHQMLRILHGRRVAGTLGDPTYASTYELRATEAALRWLRQNVPVDEIESAGLRAEKELAEMEEEIITDAERIGLWTPNSTNGDDVYGEGSFDRIRKAKEEELDMKEKRQLSQAEEIRQNTGAVQPITPRSQVELRRPGQHPKLKKYLERANVLPEEPPESSKFSRLLPSALATLAVILTSCGLASVYTPPRKNSRLWPDMPPSAATVISIIILNTLILGAWRMPILFRGLNKYFLTVPGYPFAFSMVGNMFSHQNLYHFGWNMSILWFVGTWLHEEVGRAKFLAIYMSAGAIGSFTSLACFVMRSNFVTTSLGASGALSGIIAVYLLQKSEKKYWTLPGEWPSISAMAFLIFLISVDVVCLKYYMMTRIDHWAHLGGYASGIASAGVLRLRAAQKQQKKAK